MAARDPHDRRRRGGGLLRGILTFSAGVILGMILLVVLVVVAILALLL